MRSKNAIKRVNNAHCPSFKAFFADGDRSLFAKKLLSFAYMIFDLSLSFFKSQAFRWRVEMP
jgi:hypothetical protein